MLASSIAIVSGPTPPGTGVSAPATEAASGWTSPVTTEPRLRNAAIFLEPAPNSASTSAAWSSRFMPTSTTAAPGFTNSRVTNAARPIAATRMSADAATSGNAAVREWQIVTVALRCSSIIAIGFPTMSLRPITTARAPAIGIRARSSSSITPHGVHGASAGRFCDRRPTLTGLNPSTSLVGAMASKTRCSASSPIPAGSGDCTRIPSCAALSLNSDTTASASASDAAAGSRRRSLSIPSCPLHRILLRT